MFPLQAEQELRAAQTEFDRQAEVTRLLLEGISSAHVSPTFEFCWQRPQSQPRPGIPSPASGVWSMVCQSTDGDRLC